MAPHPQPSAPPAIRRAGHVWVCPHDLAAWRRVHSSMSAASGRSSAGLAATASNRKASRWCACASASVRGQSAGGVPTARPSITACSSRCRSAASCTGDRICASPLMLSPACRRPLERAEPGRPAAATAWRRRPLHYRTVIADRAAPRPASGTVAHPSHTARGLAQQQVDKFLLRAGIECAVGSSSTRSCASRSMAQ